MFDIEAFKISKAIYIYSFVLFGLPNYAKE